MTVSEFYNLSAATKLLVEVSDNGESPYTGKQWQKIQAVGTGTATRALAIGTDFPMDTPLEVGFVIRPGAFNSYEIQLQAPGYNQLFRLEFAAKTITPIGGSAAVGSFEQLTFEERKPGIYAVKFRVDLNVPTAAKANLRLGASDRLFTSNVGAAVEYAYVAIGDSPVTIPAFSDVIDPPPPPPPQPGTEGTIGGVKPLPAGKWFGAQTHAAQATNYDGTIREPWNADVFAKLKTLGCNFIRDEFWSFLIDPPNKPYNINVHDELVKRCADNGLKLLATCWAPSEKYELRRCPVGEDGREAFVKSQVDVIRKHRANILAVEVWNEPQNDFGIRADARLMPYALAMMCKRLREELHKEFPDLPICLGGQAGSGTEFMRRFHSYGGFRHVDAVAFHSYGDTEVARATFEEVKTFLADIGRSDLPIWVTEYGANAPETSNQLRRTMSIWEELGSPLTSFYVGMDYSSFPSGGLLDSSRNVKLTGTVFKEMVDGIRAGFQRLSSPTHTPIYKIGSRWMAWSEVNESVTVGGSTVQLSQESMLFDSQPSYSGPAQVLDTLEDFIDRSKGLSAGVRRASDGMPYGAGPGWFFPYNERLQIGFASISPLNASTDAGAEVFHRWTVPADKAGTYGVVLKYQQYTTNGAVLVMLKKNGTIVHTSGTEVVPGSGVKIMRGRVTLAVGDKLELIGNPGPSGPNFDNVQLRMVVTADPGSGGTYDFTG